MEFINIFLDKHLHIITHDVPWPADYGGVIDLFYKIKSLHQLGVKIHLHCFKKRRPEQEELNKYCESVNYYPSKKAFKRFPYLLLSLLNPEANRQLLANLQKDDYPILIEGIHTTFFLQTNLLKNRKVFVGCTTVNTNIIHSWQNMKKNY